MVRVEDADHGDLGLLVAIFTKRQIVNVHGYGHDDIGIMAASALTNRRVEREDRGTELIGVQSASVDLFQFNYAELLESMMDRFRDWLDSTLAITLGEWKWFIST